MDINESINILHITDLHLDDTIIEDFDLFIRKSLKKDVLNRVNDKVDLVFITGDIIDKGGAKLGGAYEGLKIADEQVIKSIASDLNIEEESVFIIPGNHDIVRSADEDYVESGLKGKLKKSNDVNSYIRKVLKGNHLGVERLRDYRKFEEEFYSKYTCKVSDTFFTSTFIKKLNNIKIGISCLNSSWRCYSEEDKGNLLIGDREILSSIRLIEDCDIKIALIHHHIEHLSKIERNLIENILLKEYDLVFFGHSHDSNNYSKVKGGNKCIWLGAPSAFLNVRTDSREFVSGYSICKLSKTKSEIQYLYYSHRNTDFRLNTEVGQDGFDFFHSVLPENEFTTNNHHQEPKPPISKTSQKKIETETTPFNKEELLNLITKDKLEKVLDIIVEYSNDKEVINSITLLKNRLSTNKRNYMNGTKTSEAFNTNNNRIVAAIIHLIDEIE